MRITIRVELDHQDGIEATLTAPTQSVDSSSRSDVVATKDCEVAQAFSFLRFLVDAIQGRVRGGDSLGQWLRDNGIRVGFGPLKPAPTSQVQEVAS
jgi:hypothetical protein